MSSNQIHSRFRARIHVGIAGLLLAPVFVIAVHAVKVWMRWWI
jgi:hypothetical protein